MGKRDQSLHVKRIAPIDTDMKLLFDPKTGENWGGLFTVRVSRSVVERMYGSRPRRK